MLPVGDPLKDSRSSEEGEKKKKKQVRKFSPIQGRYRRNKNMKPKPYGKLNKCTTVVPDI